jgi:hypothetical protein
MYIEQFVPGTYVADLNLLMHPTLFLKFLKIKKIKAVYIVHESNFNKYSSLIPEVNFHKFSGGFMENSLILFPLDSEVDINYFEKITEIKCPYLSPIPAPAPEPSVDYTIL